MLYRKNVTKNKKIIEKNLLFNLIENDNIEFLLMH